MKKIYCELISGAFIIWKSKLLRKMRIVALLILITITQTFALDSYAQTRLSLNFKNEEIINILDAIEKQSEFYFMFDASKIDVTQRKSIDCENRTITSILDQLFEETGITYRISDRQIGLISTEFADTKQGEMTVSGKVTDSSGAVLSGVTVVIKDTTSGTITGADGSYTLSNVPANGILIFSFVGMKTQEIPVVGKTNINVTMAEETVGIEEVVAVGYGTMKRANLTGAVGLATSERLENRPIASVGMGLQGVIPNLNITIPNGDPTTSADYNVRGYESINGASPLILVDGVPMDLERINPDDIKSVSVLKDAASAAIYGARAAFGVVLVETKEGKRGERINVTLSTELSMAKPIFWVDPVTDPYVYVTERNKAFIRTQGQPLYDDLYVDGTKRWVENPTEENAWAVVNGVLRYYGSNDYKNKVVTEFMPQQKYDLSINGGTEKASYYVSFGYLNKDGYIKMSSVNDKFKRYNILMKADFKINDWLSLDEKIVVNSQFNDKPHPYGDDLNSVVRVVPIVPLQFPDLPYYVTEGDHDKYARYIGMYFGGGEYAFNWLPYLKNGGRRTHTIYDTWLTQGITLTPLKGLKIRSDFSYNNYHRDYQDVESKIEIVTDNLLNISNIINNGYSGNDFIRNTSNYNQYYVFNVYGEYTLDKFKDHYLKVLAGFNQEWGRYTSIGATAYSLLIPNITDLDATTGTQITSGGKNHISLRGAFYRLNYSYKDKYLLESNGRYDGTSRFPKESRFGFFPSVSLAWRISKEPFMAATSNWLDNLKLRTSYGTLGNQMVDDYYPYISTMGTGTSRYIMDTGSIPYVSPPGLVSPLLSWEKVESRNVGLDVTLFNQRLDISVDAYTRDTKDMLMQVEYPDILGTSAPRENAADLRTKGWESSVTWQDKIGRDWKYAITLALSDNQSEITKYENPSGALSEYYVGKKIGEIWGYVTEGIFQTDEEATSAPNQSQLGSNWRAGDIHYADLNGDKKVTAGSNTLSDPGDRKVIGNSTPRYSFGINPDVKYRNWSLNLFFQGLFRDFLPSSDGWNGFFPYNSQYIDKYFLTESWSEDNRDAYFSAPALSYNDPKNIQPQSRYVQNAAYIRLKNLSLSYNLPHEWSGKIGLTKAQVYFAGMNLWEYTKMHKPLDPEASTVKQQYYLQRIFTLGVKVTF